MIKILAIDTGVSGGFAWNDNSCRVHCIPMPQTEGDVCSFLRMQSCYNVNLVVVERVGGYIGGAGAPGSAMFNFGQGFGFILGCCAMANMPVSLVMPQKWQKALSLGSKKDYDKQWKNHLKERAQQMYPNCIGTITLKTADALLILNYGLNHLTKQSHESQATD